MERLSRVVGINVDPRFTAGYPPLLDAKRHGVRWERVVSLPENESYGAERLNAGIRVIAVFTSESNDAGLYAMSNASAIQIGNEPFMGGDASWPTGSADDFVNVWSHIANVVVKGRLPLIGPGIWCQDYGNWAQIANRLPGLSAAAVHVYPEPSLQTVSSVKSYLSKYRAVRSDLPLICTEWHTRTNVLAYARAIDSYCDAKLWYSYGPGQPGMELVGTEQFGVVVLAE
jgi:hypothetical protein